MMPSKPDQVNQGLDNIDRSDFRKELADFYRGRGYEVIAENREFPRKSKRNMGTLDLLLEDTTSPNYRIVEATKTSDPDPSVLRANVQRKKENAEKAKDYFRTNIDPDRIDTEVVIGTEDDLHAIRELLENTPGVFTWDQAVDAVTDAGRLGRFREDGYLLLNPQVSREENEEYFELSPELEETAEILYEHSTYP